VKLIIPLYLELRSRIMALYLHSPIRFHGMLLNYVIKYKDNFTLFYFKTLVKIRCEDLQYTYRTFSTETIMESMRFASAYELWAGRPGFDFRQRSKFSLPHSLQTGAGAHPASYPMGIGDSFLGVVPR
jgi:hypothetical protein